MLVRLAVVLSLALLAGLSAAPARAEPLAEIVRAEFLPGWRTESGSHMGALRLRLAHGWKTYWRAPGEAGIPPEFDWQGSENVGAVRIHWPKPILFRLNGLQTIGYARELVLPIEIVPERPGAPIRVAAQVDLGVCRDICVPASLGFAAELPARGGAADPAIRAALRARPQTAREAGIASYGCRIDPAAQGVRVTAEIAVPALGATEHVVIEIADPAVWVSEAQVRREGGRLIAEADLIGPGRTPFAIERSALTVTLLAEGRAVEISGCPALPAR